MSINPKPAIAFLVTSQTHIQAKHEGIKYACNMKDMKALFPSMKRKVAKTAIKKMILRSKVK